ICGHRCARPVSRHLKPGLGGGLRWGDRSRLDQPFSWIVGGKRNAFGLARGDHKGVEPEWLPAVIEAVEQAKMMAVQMDRLDIIGTVLAGEDDHASASNAKQRFSFVDRRQRVSAQVT